MKTHTYLRPREKIAERAIHTLSINELLQAIIGSGSAQYSVRYIARKVQSLIRHGTPSIHALRQVNGVGEALASRLAAVFEYAERRIMPVALKHAVDHYAPRLELEYVDISGKLLLVSQFDRRDSHSLLLHRICKQAILVSASGVAVRLQYQGVPSTSVLDDLCLIRELTTALGLFEVNVLNVYRQWGAHRKELV